MGEGGWLLVLFGVCLLSFVVSVTVLVVAVVTL